MRRSIPGGSIEVTSVPTLAYMGLTGGPFVRIRYQFGADKIEIYQCLEDAESLAEAIVMAVRQAEDQASRISGQ
jgi:hypothetical protein